MKGREYIATIKEKFLMPAPIEPQLCKICHVRETVSLSCGHAIACEKCVLSQTNCPVCKSPKAQKNWYASVKLSPKFFFKLYVY